MGAGSREIGMTQMIYVLLYKVLWELLCIFAIFHTIFKKSH